MGLGARCPLHGEPGRGVKIWLGSLDGIMTKHVKTGVRARCLARPVLRKWFRNFRCVVRRRQMCLSLLSLLSADAPIIAGHLPGLPHGGFSNGKGAENTGKKGSELGTVKS